MFIDYKKLENFDILKNRVIECILDNSIIEEVGNDKFEFKLFSDDKFEPVQIYENEINNQKYIAVILFAKTRREICKTFDIKENIEEVKEEVKRFIAEALADNYDMDRFIKFIYGCSHYFK